jgi:hypothetical protein
MASEMNESIRITGVCGTKIIGLVGVAGGHMGAIMKNVAFSAY